MAPAGAHFRSVISRLGIANELQGTPAGVPSTTGIAAALRATSVQYMAAGVATLRALPGVGRSGALSDDVQSYTTYTAAVAESASEPRGGGDPAVLFGPSITPNT